MSAVAAMVGNGGTNIVVTLGSAAGTAGYVRGASGSASPESYMGKTLQNIRTAAGFDFFIEMGIASQSFFRSVLVTAGDGSKRRFASADATYATSGGTLASWTWGDGSTPLWQEADGGEVKVVEFFL